ncbi:T9SS type B sorting domain-containing protein [Sphingobacterium olei]|uniref:T9SS type B sorting domain-containing protein n=1 Tax=Sphingobacterium olei TaxID=2571155 RepID=A0A4U0P7N3_9SPHI|nr:gliding motility-associated C-terminal domain-containing protein [Sphingobacterium olei]TJZ63521.1 T9SS type B sorting domain-containing protein [Sphingobacterium olei]
MNINIKTFLLLFFLGVTASVSAQNGINSFETDNGAAQVDAGTYKFIYSENLYLGPNADWKIDGNVEIYAKNIWIAPTAKISGTGTLVLHSPSQNPFYENWAASPTHIDGNDGTFIDVRIVLNNPEGLRLSDIANPGFDGLSLPTDEKAAAFKLGKALDLRVDGANIFLNSHDLELATNGELLNYSRNRMVVTENRLSGHMIKNYIGVAQFVFPVGIEKQDYTPATLIPSVAVSKLYVTVTDYTASGLVFEDETIGMDRVWNIYGDRDMQVDYTLTHNMVTNGMVYVDAEAQIVQNADGGNWIGDVTVFDGEGVHTRGDIETRTGNTLAGTWFTKFADRKIGPTARDDNGTMEYGDNITINILENDEAGSSPIITGSVTVVREPVNGRVEVHTDGSITYIPHPDFVGTDTFEYEITDENGLKSKAVVTIDVLPRELFIPNVITPNGDGKNDQFVIVGREGYDRIELIIVNRWGNEVYRNDDYKDEWEGRGLNEGTYFPIIRAIKGNQERVFKGHVLIKRN